MKWNCGKYHELFDSLPFDIQCSQGFLEFISKENVTKRKDEQGKTKQRKVKYENLELLINLEEKYPRIFVKVMTNFDKAKSYREGIDEKMEKL